MIRERQREGIAIAKQAGVYRGWKPSLTVEEVKSFGRGQQPESRRRHWRGNTGNAPTIYNAFRVELLNGIDELLDKSVKIVVAHGSFS